MHENDTIIGIDLGTTNSVVAVLEDGQPHIIINAEGATKTPSIVSFLTNGEVVVGELARRQTSVNPERTVTSAKRLMGRTLADIEALDLALPYDLVEHEGELLVRIDDVGYTPAQISAFILSKLKESAEAYLGETVSRAIITVPAYFDDMQRQATLEAAQHAGLQVLRLINEPTAAAMAYGLGREGAERVLVYDLGGGTFDITVLDIHDNAFEVLTTLGDSHLGGDDFDEVIAQMLYKHLCEKAGDDALPLDAMMLRRLRDAAEKAKCELSVARQAVVHLPFFCYVAEQPLHIEFTLHREDFEDQVYPLVQRTLDLVGRALEDCNTEPDQVDKVILVGGSTRMPLVQEMVEEAFGRPPFKGLNPDEIVALGAATQAGVLGGKLQEVVLLEVTPHSLGVEVSEGKVSRIIEKNSTIPLKAAKVFTTTEDDQDVVVVHVLQGEEERATQNRSLGKFSLTGIPPAKAGAPRVQIVFHINASGMVEVSAEDMQTKEQKSISVTLLHQTSPDLAMRDRVRPNSSTQRRRRRRAAGSMGDSTGASRRAAESSGSSRMTPASPANNPLRQARIRYENIAEEVAEEPAIYELDNVSDELPTEVLAVPPSNETPAPTAAATAEASEPETPSGAQTIVGRRPTEQIQEDARNAEAERGRSDSAADTLDAQTRVENVPKTFSKTSSTDDLGEIPRKALSLLQNNETSPEAHAIYLRAFEELREFVAVHPGEVDVAYLYARLLMLIGEHGHARPLLLSLAESEACHAETVASLCDLFLHNRKDDDVSVARARLLARMGQEDTAIADLETIVGDDKGTPSQLDLLATLYESRLRQATSDDPETQFRLVKIHLRRNHIDDAIPSLQRLVQVESYRTHALRVLGLCFWKKGMHYLAWQKFQQLEVNDEMKDILYRLAGDMENTEQLLNAKAVLEHLRDSGGPFRDVEERIVRINQLQQLQNSGTRGGAANAPGSPLFQAFRDSRFIILEEINRGSMGIVYRAKDKILDEIVALKVLNDYLTSDPTAVERFKREARAAKRLSHPNIVRIHDMFEVGAKKLLSMEYIEGRDIKKLLLDKKIMTLAELVHIMDGICDALTYAHKQGIIHRDIKPANVMMTNDDVIKVTDFGIAKILLSGPEATRSGTQILGTPLYMSPEQIRGETVDQRSDVYSLGATLYEMVAGRPPFSEGNIEYHHLHTAPPPLPDTTPAALQEIILAMIAKRVNERIGTVDEVRERLKKLL